MAKYLHVTYNQFGRTYHWPVGKKGKKSLPLLSVTSLIDNLPKDWMNGWAAREAVKETCRLILAQAIKPADLSEHVQDLVYVAAHAYEGIRDEAAHNGTIRHRAVEERTKQLAKILKKDPSNIQPFRDLLKRDEEESKTLFDPIRYFEKKPDELDTHPYVAAALDFMETKCLHPKSAGIEVEVANPDVGYAGCVDLICRDVSGKYLWVIDWKTGNNIHPDAGMQIIAYSRAPYRMVPSKNKYDDRMVVAKNPFAKYEEAGRIRRAVVHLRGDGSWRMYEPKLDMVELAWDTFVALIQIYKWQLAVGPNLTPIYGKSEGGQAYIEEKFGT